MSSTSRSGLPLPDPDRHSGRVRRFVIAAAATIMVACLPMAPSSAFLAPTPAGTVAIGGNPTAGHTWVVRTNGWAPLTTFLYQWFVGVPTATSVPFATTTSPSFVMPASYLGKLVTVRVTGTPDGLTLDTPVSVVSAPLRVQVPNPLAGGAWNAPNGPYQYKWDGPAWVSPTGTVYAPSAIENRPRVTWLPGPDDKRSTPISTQISTQMDMLRKYIAVSQNGDPHALTQLALFGIFSIQGGEGYIRTPLTSQEMANYHAWINAVASTLGQTRVAIVLEPDLAITTNGRNASNATRQGMTRWAASVLSKNPHATIYLSAGDADWLSPTQAATLLKASGIQYARGFDLGDTHYSTTGAAINQGTAIVKALATLGYKGRHFVVDTSDNGRGFGFSQDPSRAVCASRSTPAPCVTLGVPPTWQVIDTRQPLTATQKYYALRLQDADLWIGRPWNQDQAWPFLPARAKALAGSSPYA